MHILHICMYVYVYPCLCVHVIMRIPNIIKYSICVLQNMIEGQVIVQYSGKFSQDKILADFAVSLTSTKILSVNFQFWNHL